MLHRPADPTRPERAWQVAGGEHERVQQQRQRGVHPAARRVRGRQAAPRQPLRRQAPHEARGLHLPQLRPGREVITTLLLHIHMTAWILEWLRSSTQTRVCAMCRGFDPKKVRSKG